MIGLVTNGSWNNDNYYIDNPDLCIKHFRKMYTHVHSPLQSLQTVSHGFTQFKVKCLSPVHYQGHKLKNTIDLQEVFDSDRYDRNCKLLTNDDRKITSSRQLSVMYNYICTLFST